MNQFLHKYLQKWGDDILLLAGCLFIIYGVAQFNGPLACIVTGIMLIGLAIMIGKVNSDVTS